MTTTWETTRVRHGTASGWNLHKKLGERACDACAAGKSKYDQSRKAVPVYTIMSRLRGSAQQRAFAALRDQYPEQYRAAYLEARRDLLEERADEIAVARAETHSDADSQMATIFANLHAVLDPDATDRWLATPVKNMGGRTPQELLDAGKLTRVLQLTSYLDPSFG
jgi:Protein of unknown function (DUF2384)